MLWLGMDIADVCHEVLMPVSIPTDRLLNLTEVKTAQHFEHDKLPWPLKIYTLGRFGLVRDGVHVNFSGKVPRKPLELLKALVAFGGRGISEERLIDQLWPYTEAGADRSFSSALHRLRRLLGDNHFISRQDKLITLDASFCWVDAWAFERLSKQAQSILQKGGTEQESALQMAHLAIAHYTGHFLPADGDQKWTISMRERLRGKMLNLITIVGQHLETATDWHEALAIYQKGLETDDLNETFYQRQMVCYCQLGNHGEVASVYQHCCRKLAMLGVNPSAQTKGIFKASLSPSN